MTTRSPVVLGMLISIVSYVCYTCFDTVIKTLALKYSLFQILSTSLAGAALFTVAVSLVVHRKNLSHEFIMRRWQLHVVRGILVVITQFFYFSGFTHVPLATFYVILFGVPILAGVLGGIFMKEKLTVQLVATLGLSFAGTLIALQPWQSMQMESLPWVLLIFIGTIFSSIGILVLRRMMLTEGLASSALSTIVILMVAFAIPASFDYVKPEWEDLALMMLAGLFYTAGVKSIILALRLAPTSYVAAMQFLQLVFGSIAGYVFFADRPSFWVYVGGAIVIGANLYLLFAQNRKPKAEVLGSPA